MNQFKEIGMPPVWVKVSPAKYKLYTTKRTLFGFVRGCAGRIVYSETLERWEYQPNFISFGYGSVVLKAITNKLIALEKEDHE